MQSDSPWHGTTNGYNNLKCRCEACRAAWAEFCAEMRMVRRIKLLSGDGAPTHGKASTYGNYGCRCQPCTTAWTVESTARARRRRERTTHA